MLNKEQIITAVDSKPIYAEEIKSYFISNYSLTITGSKSLSNEACDFYVPSISDSQNKEIRNYFYSQKMDCCIQAKRNREKKILLSDMDATIIENETLDDLVKISGVTANIDETSRLAMEGKIDIRTTLNLRVNYLKINPNH
jgi:Phosphoserine phosphatase